MTAAPGNAADWASPGSSPSTRAVIIQTKAERIFPVETYPAVRFDSGDLAFVQLGVYESTFQQLIDNPVALSRPESRAFAGAVLVRLQHVHQQFADGLSAAPMQALLAQPIVADPEWLDTNFRQPLTRQVNIKWPKNARVAYVLGSVLAQVAYNAAVTQDRRTDAFRETLTTLPLWNGISAKTRADIARLKAIPPLSQGAKWTDINAAASAATLDIVNGS
jgi:hypothetical protein